MNIRKRLWALTMRDCSGMRACLTYDRDNVDMTYVLFENNLPVAWALACWYEYGQEYSLMFYTRRDKRRKGYGRKLYKKMISWLNGTKYIVYDDQENTRFWKRVGECKRRHA